MMEVSIPATASASSSYSRLLAAFIQGAEESAFTEFGRSLGPADYTRLIEEFPQDYVEIVHPSESRSA